MPKAGRVKVAIEKAGWELLRIRGSHHIHRQSGRIEVFAVELSGAPLAKVAKQFGSRQAWAASAGEKVMAIIRLPIHLEYDEETLDWHYHARIGDTIGVTGGGQASRQEAIEAASESIAIALEAHDEADEGEIEYLQLAVG